jgi:adenine deaminase
MYSLKVSNETDVAIANGIFLGFGGEGGYGIKEEYDAQGRIMCPGFIGGHVHIESTFLSPTESCKW